MVKKTQSEKNKFMLNKGGIKGNGIEMSRTDREQLIAKFSKGTRRKVVS